MRWKSIERLKYNDWYKKIKGEKVPGYLKKGWGKDRWQMLTRYRLGNEMRDGRYWEENKRLCGMCGTERETWEHVWNECGEWGIEKS